MKLKTSLFKLLLRMGAKKKTMEGCHKGSKRKKEVRETTSFKNSLLKELNKAISRAAVSPMPLVLSHTPVLRLDSEIEGKEVRLELEHIRREIKTGKLLTKSGVKRVDMEHHFEPVRGISKTLAIVPRMGIIQHEKHLKDKFNKSSHKFGKRGEEVKNEPHTKKTQGKFPSQKTHKEIKPNGKKAFDRILKLETAKAGSGRWETLESFDLSPPKAKNDEIERFSKRPLLESFGSLPKEQDVKLRSGSEARPKNFAKTVEEKKDRVGKDTLKVVRREEKLKAESVRGEPGAKSKSSVSSRLEAHHGRGDSQHQAWRISERSDYSPKDTTSVDRSLQSLEAIRVLSDTGSSTFMGDGMEKEGRGSKEVLGRGGIPSQARAEERPLVSEEMTVKAFLKKLEFNLREGKREATVELHPP
ncbi:MAG: hypothetical protein J7M13_06950, partial [Synergistetes bacterium]|nr:hypothetical protein [Synergistota bacterium]